MLRLAYRYARAVDRRLPEELASLFTAEGVIARAGTPSWLGRQAILKIPERLDRMYASTLHTVRNQTVAISGDEAEGETYCIAYHLGHKKDGVQTRLDWGIRYQDQFARLNGQWLFARRELIVDWTETTELPISQPQIDLAALNDERAIERVYSRYCDVIDGKDFARLDEVFTPECIGDYRSTNGKLMEGLAPLVAHVTRGMGPGSDCGATHHNCFNHRIAVDGDTARSKAHFFAVHEGINRCAGEHYTCWGEYDDLFVRTTQGWRVARRTYRNFLIDGTVDVVRATRS
jgi:hypothetical protein